MTHSQQPGWPDFVIGGASTVAACIFSNPVEVVKTRMQLQGELQSRALLKQGRTFRNPFQAFGLILSTEGLAGIQKGLVPACLYQFSMNGIRLGSYNYIRSVFASVLPYDTNQYPLCSRVLAGATAGMIGAVTGSPFYLVKTRMQASSTVTGMGTQHNYKNFWDGLRSVVQSEGPMGLLRGAKVAALRVAMGSAVQLSTYDTCKDSLILRTAFFGRTENQGLLLHFSAAMMSGLMVTTAMNPADVMATRLYNQTAGAELYSSIPDCFKKILKTEGVYGFYKGWLAHYLRVGPHTVLTFVFLEQFRRLWYGNNQFNK